MTAPLVTCIGEAIVDFVSAEQGKGLDEVRRYAASAGGAPANVAAGLSRLGIRTAFAGKVGGGPFGRFVRRELEERGVDTSGVIADPRCATRLAFVAVTKHDRDFVFAGFPPADAELRFSDLNLRSVFASRLVHIGSFMLLGKRSGPAALEAARRLSARGVPVSFDPNLRLSLWRSAMRARAAHLAMIRRCAVVRLNKDEALFLTGARSLQGAIAALHRLGPAVVVATMGRNGCHASVRGAVRFVAGFRVNEVDTTGCGDAFLAALLAGMVRSKLRPETMSADDLERLCRFANAAGALTATKRGVFPALPSRRAVEAFLRRRGGV